MRYWHLFISASLLLSACDGDSNETGTDGTFVSAEADPQVSAPGASGADLTIKPAAFVAPEDHVVEDRNVYSAAADASLPPAAVDETPAVKNHQTMINGKLVCVGYDMILRRIKLVGFFILAGSGQQRCCLVFQSSLFVDVNGLIPEPGVGKKLRRVVEAPGIKRRIGTDRHRRREAGQARRSQRRAPFVLPWLLSTDDHDRIEQRRSPSVAP